MFVHLGADCIVKSNEIIAIFNLNSPDCNIYKKFIKNNEDKYEIVDVTEDGVYYSCVLTEKKIYLSAISSMTLYKRKVNNFLTNGGMYD